MASCFPSLRQPARALGTLATCLGLLATAVPAQAAIYVGSFDPAFGGNFTGLGWKGEVVFDVADACLALGNATAANAECQDTQVQSAFVTLYSLSDPSQFEVLDYFGSQIRLSIFDITVAGGVVTGIQTTLMRSPFGTMDQAFPGDWLAPAGTLGPTVADWYDLYRYGLSIDGEDAMLSASSTSIGFGPGGAFDLLPGQCPWDGDYAICDSATRPTVTFTLLPPPGQVPEPASLALVGLALAGAAAARRRRRAG